MRSLAIGLRGQIRPPHPTRHPSPPPPPVSAPFVRLRPDKLRQPELLRQLEERNPQPSTLQRQQPALKPALPALSYQLKPKRGQKKLAPALQAFIEPPVEHPEVSPPPNAKQIKRMKKKLGKLNKEIRHSNRKRNNLVSKRNSIRKKIEELKGPREPESWIPALKLGLQAIELQQAFNRVYRSYKINGRSRMDIDTFFNRIRQNLIDLISRELTDLNSVRVQTNIGIRFRIKHEEGIIDRVRLAFSSWRSTLVLMLT